MSLFSLSCAFITFFFSFSFQAKPCKPWTSCLETMIHMMKLNGSTLSILLNTFHITSQGYSLAEACEISESLFTPSLSLFPPLTLTAEPFCVHLCCPHGLGYLSCCQQGDRLKGQAICLSCAVARSIYGDVDMT